MNALFRLLAGFLAIIFTVTFGGPAHRRLPPRVRIGSFGFISMAIAFFGAAVLRHVLVGGYDLEKLLIGHALYFVFLLRVCGQKYAAELTLYMAGSVGVDITIAALGLLGLDITTDSVRHPALAWEFLAALVAIIRLHLARRSAGAA